MTIEKMPYHALPGIGYAFSASLGNRVSLPVSPSMYIYSHFKHVSGVPAPQNIQGISIPRLKILDTVIDALVRMKQQPQPSMDLPEGDAEKRLNAFIIDLQKQVHTAQTTTASAPYRLPAPDLGLAFSLSA